MAKLGGNTAITSKSLFHMASVTKTFVATAVMQLVEEGKIDLDAPLLRYLPYFRLADERYRVITWLPATRDADFYQALKLRQQYPNLTFKGVGKVSLGDGGGKVEEQRSGAPWMWMA